MSPKNYEIIKNRKEWLDKEYSQYFDTIRECVLSIHSENATRFPDLPFYTPHGIEHCEAVESLIYKLIPQKNDSEKLSQKERFYLLASAWLHDLGMLRLVVNEVGESSNHTITEIRSKHHINSQKFITEQFNRCGLREEDRELVGKLCKYHRKQEDLTRCDEKFTVGTEVYRLRLLAAYLRLADALHVGTSRTPTYAYVICLAYDIPAESKLHWIKSKFVNGLEIDPESHTITIEFRIPEKDSIEIEQKQFFHKINEILELVKNDLYEELSSVVNVLTRFGPTYFLDIEEKRTEVVMTNQMLHDIRELVLNFDIMVAPSASKLLEMILVTISNIAGYSIEKNKDKPIKFKEINTSVEDNRKDKIIDFIEQVEKGILKNRPCHLGLKALIRDLKKHMDLLPKDFHGFVEKIFEMYKKHHQYRRRIRENAKSFFSDKIKDQQIKLNSLPVYNILLFGYSELVVKAVCGFRDSLINQIATVNNGDYSSKDFYNSELEKKVSQKIRIFICEGQSKTQTGINDRLLYHDGSQYAVSFAQRSFENIIIIPDIVVDNVIKNNSIDVVMVGANGFTDKNFRHSAGHSSIINLVRWYKNKEEKLKIIPKIVLVVSSEKLMSDEDLSAVTIKGELKDEEVYEKKEVDGYWFWKGLKHVSTREHVWILRDQSIAHDLNQNNIRFYNPREDVIPIEAVDFIISDTGFHGIASDSGKVKENIAEFISSIKKKCKVKEVVKMN